MHTGLFCINGEGRNPNTDSKKQHEAGNYADSSLAHPFRFRSAVALDQIEEPLTH